MIFTSGGTEAINLAILGLSLAVPARFCSRPGNIRRPAKRADSSSSTAGSSACSRSIRTGGSSEDALDDLPWAEIQLATVILAHNETGVVQDVAPLAARCQEFRHSPASRRCAGCRKNPGRFPRPACDGSFAGAHKFHGPRGIGASVVCARGHRFVPRQVGGHQESERRAGTEPVALAVGMAVALERWQAERDARRIRGFASCATGSSEVWRAPVHRAVVNGSRAHRLPNTLNIAFPGVDGEALLVALDLAGIACSLGSTCASGSTEPAPVLVAMGSRRRFIRRPSASVSASRISREEIDEAVRVSHGAVDRLRRSVARRRDQRLDTPASTGRSQSLHEPEPGMSGSMHRHGPHVEQLPISSTASASEPLVLLKENRLAHAANRPSQQVGRRDWLVYLYGPAGVGKSHLVRHFVREARRKTPRREVICETTTEFVEALAQAYTRQDRVEFQTEHTEADLFVLEDVAAVAGSPPGPADADRDSGRSETRRRPGVSHVCPRFRAAWKKCCRGYQPLAWRPVRAAGVAGTRPADSGLRNTSRRPVRFRCRRRRPECCAERSRNASRTSRRAGEPRICDPQGLPDSDDSLMRAQLNAAHRRATGPATADRGGRRRLLQDSRVGTPDERPPETIHSSASNRHAARARVERPTCGTNRPVLRPEEPHDCRACLSPHATSPRPTRHSGERSIALRSGRGARV